jgi:hypothetical protein
MADRDFALMRDFIGGRLSDHECRAFEDRLARDPGLAHELEQSLRIREGLQQLRTRGYIRKTRPVRWSFRSWVPAALAAAAIAGLALFLWVPRAAGPVSLLMASPGAHAAGDAASRVAAHFTFVSMRGASTPDLELPSAGLIEIRAAPGTRPAAERYRVTLVRRDDSGSARTIALLRGLAVGTDGYVHCYADATRLSAGNYLLRVQPDNDTGLADVFPFNLNVGTTRPPRPGI